MCHFVGQCRSKKYCGTGSRNTISGGSRSRSSNSPSLFCFSWSLLLSNSTHRRFTIKRRSRQAVVTGVVHFSSRYVPSVHRAESTAFPLPAYLHRILTDIMLFMMLPSVQDEGWDFGTAAGFYVDATEPGWKDHVGLIFYLVSLFFSRHASFFFLHYLFWVRLLTLLLVPRQKGVTIPLPPSLPRPSCSTGCTSTSPKSCLGLSPPISRLTRPEHPFLGTPWGATGRLS